MILSIIFIPKKVPLNPHLLFYTTNSETNLGFHPQIPIPKTWVTVAKRQVRAFPLGVPQDADREVFRSERAGAPRAAKTSWDLYLL